MATVDAEEARRVCSRALTVLLNGRTMEAQVILSDYAQKCGALVEQEKMTAEQDAAALGAGSLDLKELDSLVDLHHDQPERE